jgi:hypothetical protein
MAHSGAGVYRVIHFFRDTIMSKIIRDMTEDKNLDQKGMAVVQGDGFKETLKKIRFLAEVWALFVVVFLAGLILVPILRFMDQDNFFLPDD